MISYNEALKLIENHILKIESEIIPLSQALNRICAKKIDAPFSMPRFNNSAMDGFALDWKQSIGASKSNPKKFKVIKSIAAGDDMENIHFNNEPISAEIMTGAPLPNYFNTVIPVEEIKEISNKNLEEFFIEIEREAKESENIRYIGEDFFENHPLIFENECITHEKIMILSAFGFNQVVVKKKIKVAILSTGKELVDSFSQKLDNQQIYNSNSPYLDSIIKEYPIESKIFTTVPDDKNLFLETINNIKKQGFQLIVSTGAVSKGKWDIIPECLNELGAKIIFHKVKIKPGKPILFAQLNESLFYFGLPGNPISTAVGFRFFISPFLRMCFGLKKEKMLNLKLESSGNKKLGMTFFLKGKIFIDNFSIVKGVILSGQESFKMKSFSESNGWIILLEDVECYKENDFACFLPLEVNSKLFF